MKRILWVVSLLAFSLGASGCDGLPASGGASVCRGFGGASHGLVMRAFAELDADISQSIRTLTPEDVRRALHLRSVARIRNVSDPTPNAGTMPGGGAPMIMVTSGLRALLSATQLEAILYHEVGHHLLNSGGHEAEALCDLIAVAAMAALGYADPAGLVASALRRIGNGPDSATHPATADRARIIQRYAPTAIAVARQATSGQPPPPQTEQPQPRSVPASAPTQDVPGVPAPSAPASPTPAETGAHQHTPSCASTKRWDGREYRFPPGGCGKENPNWQRPVRAKGIFE